jgi:histidinol dehydrogenase
MNIFRFPDKNMWSEILQRPTSDYEQVKKAVNKIFNEVKSKGDDALRSLSHKYDGVKLTNFLVDNAEIKEAVDRVDISLKNAIQKASKNIKKFHLAQNVKLQIIETQPGVKCWQKSVPIEKVGLYIPGGTAPLFSSVLMLGIPAKIANCSEIILCSPANKEGKINSAILYAANLIGVKKIFKIGGAQAIAAMTFGTGIVPKVDKIFGPGNQYVTFAKQMSTMQGVAIDMPAGPSEVLVLADNTARADFVAADLLSQAEHGVDSQVIFVTVDEDQIKKVQKAINKQLKILTRKEIASVALENSKIVLVKNISIALDLVNFYAPEHLILMVKNPKRVADKVTNAGSVFLGHLTPESVGDYATGTNHTLPTAGFARSYSGVTLDSFMKKITFQKVTSNGLKKIGSIVEIMAAAEGLDGHKRSITIRTKKPIGTE